MVDKITNWTAPDDAMVENAIRGGASRRDVLSMLLAGGVAISAGGLILGRASTAVAGTPKSGGHLRAAGWAASTADTLDPAKAIASTDYVRCCALYNRLTFLDASSTPQMELAESLESADARVWTVKLRSGISFHDGKALTSGDVVFSLKRHLDPAVGSKVNSIAKQITDVRAVNPLTVEVTLAGPNSDLPTILAMHQFMIVQDGTTDFSRGIGTGAFMMKTFEPGVKSIFVKNPNYFKSGRPYLDSFEYFGIPDDNARVNALLSGDIQLAAGIAPQSVRLVESQPSVAMVKTTSGFYVNLDMRLDQEPGSNADFVAGMKYLFDRERIRKSVFRGLAVVGNDQPISPANIYHNPDLKPKAYDPERAKFHFNKSGLMGRTIPMLASEAATGSVDMATIVQQAGVDVGMKFDLQRMPSDGYFANYWTKAPVIFASINPRPTADMLFSLFYQSGAPWNESRFRSDKFDQMLIEARGLFDQAKRKQIYGEMQAMVAEQAGTVIPSYLTTVDAISKKLRGLELNPLGGQMGYAFAEYVWLDA